MPRQPGTHTSTVYALKSSSAGKYLSVRAWAYNPQDPYKIRELELKTNPVSVCRVEKTARTLLSLVPQKLEEMIQDYDKEIARIKESMDKVVLDRHRIRADWYQHQIEHHDHMIKSSIDRQSTIITILNNPINIIKIVTITNTSETVIP